MPVDSFRADHILSRWFGQGHFRAGRASPRAGPHGRDVRDTKWLELKDEALETLLVERWLFRGALLVLMLVSAIFTTYLGMQGLHTVLDQLTVSALVCLMFGAGAVAFVMRNTDIRIHQELQRRRRS